MPVDVTEPWSDDEPDVPPPRRPGWGCLAAVIVAGIGTVIAAIFAARLIAALLSGVQIR